MNKYNNLFITTILSHFKNNKDPVRRKLYEKKIAPKTKKSNWMNVEEGIAKMREVNTIIINLLSELTNILSF